jgi:hypothetical protein
MLFWWVSFWWRHSAKFRSAERHSGDCYGAVHILFSITWSFYILWRGYKIWRKIQNKLTFYEKKTLSVCWWVCWTPKSDVVAQQSVTKIINLAIVNFVTPKAGDKHELLFNKLASGAAFTTLCFLRNLRIGQIS